VQILLERKGSSSFEAHVFQTSAKDFGLESLAGFVRSQESV
jgi:hypothetical protein